jgi:cell division protein FtsB
MNLPSAYNNGGTVGRAGAVELGGSAQAAPVNPAYQVGEIGFGPFWSDEPSARELYDQACASIVRAECEADELRAEVAMLKQGMVMLAEERDEERLRVRSVNAFASSLVKTIGELKAERVELKATINTYRDEACRESCRDKASADGGWANI